jgi:hypothetical protein
VTSWADRLRDLVPGEEPAPRVRRAPVLRPGPRGWLGLAQVRGLQIAVEDGVVVIRHPDGGAEQRAAPGEVTRIVLVTDALLGHIRLPSHASGGCPAAEHGLLVLLAGQRPVLALWVTEWVPGPALELDEVTARRLAGVEAVATALGLPVEPADLPTVRDHRPGILAATVSAVPHARGRGRALRRCAFGALIVFAVAFFVVGIAGSVQEYRGVAGPLPFPAPIAWAASLAAAGLIVTELHARRAAATLIRASPAAAEQAWAPRPAVEVPTGFLDRARLLLRPDAIVVRDAEGREAWLPGPAVGGVDRAVLTDEALLLVDSSGAEHLAVPHASWAGSGPARRELSHWLTAGGLRLSEGLPSRWPWFAGPFLLGALTLPWLGAGREVSGLASSNAVAGVTFAAGAAGCFSLLAGGPVGIGCGVLGLAAALLQLCASVARAVSERRRARPVRP